MPSPDYSTNNEMFDIILATNIRIILASALGYLISEPLNSLIMAKLKIKMHGRYLGIRFVSSTIIASGTDSLIFGLIAFCGTMNNIHLFSLIATMWLIKVIIEMLGLPISIKLAKALKESERIDIYDKRTNFNIFSLETTYLDEDNQYFKNE